MNGNSLSDAGYEGDAWAHFEECQNVTECDALLTLTLASRTGTHAAERDAMVAAVLNAAEHSDRNGWPEVVPVIRLRDRTTGTLYGMYGVPLGVKREDLDSVPSGFTFRNRRDGTTHCPKPFATAEEAQAYLDNNLASTLKRFADELATMTDQRIASQYGYWVKA